MLPPSDTIRAGLPTEAVGLFQLFALAGDRIDTEGLSFVWTPATNKESERMARAGALDLVPMSPLALPPGWQVLAPGAELRGSGGPWLLTREPTLIEALELGTIAAPAASNESLLASLRLPGARVVDSVGSDRIRRVLSGDVQVAVFSPDESARHEVRILNPVIDLAGWWCKENPGLALPLMVWACAPQLPPELVERLERVLRRAVVYALANRRDAVAFAVAGTQGLDAPAIEALIDGCRIDDALDGGILLKKSLAALQAAADPSRNS